MKLLKFLLCGLLMALPVLAEETEDRQTATSLHYVSHELDTRQDKLSTGSNKALTYTNTAGNIEQRTVKSDLTGGTTDTSLPQVNAVNAGLDTKQNDIDPINDHTAVTYTENVGTIGAKGIYQDTGNYAAQSDNLIDAKTFNAALKNGLDSEFICTDHKPGTDLCWLWEIHSTGANSNLFNKNNSAWIFRNRSLATTQDGYWFYAYGSTSLVCPCSPNTTYTISGLADGGTIYRVATIDIDSLPTNTATNAIPYSFIYRETTKPESYTFTTPATAKWIVVQVGNIVFDDTLNTIQIEKGSTATAPKPYTTLVPDGYTPVEFIQSSGAQYFDSGRKATNLTNINITATATESNSQKNRLLGNYATLSKGFTINMSSTTGANRFGSQLTYVDAMPVGGKHVFSNGADGLKIDGAVLQEWEPSEAFETDGNVALLASTDTTTTVPSNITNGLVGKTYGITWYENGVLVMDLVPAIQNSDNKVGMYDTVSGRFFENAGSGTFTAGEPINNIVYIPQNQ